LHAVFVTAELHICYVIRYTCL